MEDDNVLVNGAIAVIMTALLLAIGVGILETGPNCPGADPSWIGWCSDAPPAH